MKKTKGIRISYHWVIFIVCFLMVLVGLGFASSTRGTYKTAILDDNSIDIDYFFYSFFDSIRFVTTAILNLFFGSLIARFGVRKLAGAGFVFLASACLVCSFATQYWHFYVGAVFMGAGFSWVSTSIVAFVVEKWFSNGKGTIMGIILAANGLGGAISEIIISPMVLSEDGLGWRFAYRFTAALFLVMTVVVILFLRSRPSLMGLEPLWKDRQEKKKRGADWEGYDFSLIKKKWYFYIAALCVFVTGMVLQAMVGIAKTHIYSVLGRADEVVIWVTGVFTVHSLILMFSKICAGASFDRFGIRFTFGYCSLFSIIAVLSLAFLTPDRSVLTWFYGITSSLALPLETVMIPLLVAEMFGRSDYPKILGYFLGINVFGYSVGGPIADFFKQNSDSYNGILIFFCILMLFSSILIQICFYYSGKDQKAFLQKREALSE